MADKELIVSLMLVMLDVKAYFQLVYDMQNVKKIERLWISSMEDSAIRRF